MAGLYFDSEAQDVLNQHEAAQNTPVENHPGMLSTIGQGLARGGLKLVKGAAITASALNENPDGIYRMIDKYIEPSIKANTPDPRNVTLAGQIVGAVSELPGQLLLGPVGLLNSTIMNTGADLVDSGVDPGTATLAGIGMGVATAGMMGLPQAGTSIPKTAALVGLNPVLGAATDLAINKSLEASGYTEQAQQFDPLNPASRTVDTVMGLIFGALGYRYHMATGKEAPTGTKEQIKAAKDIIKQAGGYDGVMDKLPVEVVDALSVSRDYEKQFESNPFDSSSPDGLQQHIDLLSKAVDDIQEAGRVDVSGAFPKLDTSPEEMQQYHEAVKHFEEIKARRDQSDDGLQPPEAPAQPILLRTSIPKDVQQLQKATVEHVSEVADELHGMAGTDRATVEAQWKDNLIKPNDAISETASNPDSPISLQSHVIDSDVNHLDIATDRLFSERGDFQVYQGKDASGNDVYSSAQELVSSAKEDLSRTEMLKDVYKQAALCLGIGV